MLVDLLNRIVPLTGGPSDECVDATYHETLPDGTDLWFEQTGTDGWEIDGAEEYVKSKIGDNVFTAQISRSYVVNGDVVYAPQLYIGYAYNGSVVTEVVVYGGEMHEKNGLIDGKNELFDCILFGMDGLAINHWVKVDVQTTERKVDPGYIDRMTDLMLGACDQA